MTFFKNIIEDSGGLLESILYNSNNLEFRMLKKIDELITYLYHRTIQTHRINHDYLSDTAIA